MSTAANALTRPRPTESGRQSHDPVYKRVLSRGAQFGGPIIDATYRPKHTKQRRVVTRQAQISPCIPARWSTPTKRATTGLSPHAGSTSGTLSTCSGNIYIERKLSLSSTLRSDVPQSTMALSSSHPEHDLSRDREKSAKSVTESPFIRNNARSNANTHVLILRAYTEMSRGTMKTATHSTWKFLEASDITAGPIDDPFIPWTKNHRFSFILLFVRVHRKREGEY